ncbi:MAG: NTP transferase domain-containing protein [Deltaproteobacteria bacterium]|nr:NTP transferase domain-containing protein [Deltaproteobacteria bacterium]MBW2153095.1 NTP transferase domain-containing protein [Deltaproteobacteria bacterium]
MKYVDNDVAAIVLAAGLGTRMRSQTAKVLHKISGRPMILYVLETARKVVGDNVVLVIGHQAEKVRQIVSRHAMVTYAVQEKQLGTGHAVLTALPHLKPSIRQVLILYGDVPLLMPQTILKLLDDHITFRRDISLLGVELSNPYGYGRLLFDENGHLLKVVEETDATEHQRQIKTINAGIYCAKKESLHATLHQTGMRNAQGERYLTDIIEFGNKMGMNIGVVFAKDSEEIIGINTLEELEKVETIMQKRLSKSS